MRMKTPSEQKQQGGIKLVETFDLDEKGATSTPPGKLVREIRVEFSAGEFAGATLFQEGHMLIQGREDGSNFIEWWIHPYGEEMKFDKHGYLIPGIYRTYCSSFGEAVGDLINEAMRKP